ncbi:hypothetical protein MOX01_26200 [Microbacterium oxydans]|nr:hypothetical protein MOX01_26200 [Microbacterium oxydans]
MSGEIDREQRLLQGEGGGVPGVCVQAGAVEQRHTRCFATETQGAQDAAVGEWEGEARDRRNRYAERFGLCGKIAELAVVDRHLHILRPREAASEMPDQYDKRIFRNVSHYVA